ncbi:hypothetical protein GCM10020219_079640 [Nonomuraea dietziae]
MGLVRNPDHRADVESAGGQAVVCDLESASAEQVAKLLDGADAVVFAAGAGPGSGAARKDTVDRGASVLLAEAAERAGVRRFVQISSMGAGAPPRPGTDEVWAAYIAAKTAAEDDLPRPRPRLDDPAARRPDRRAGRGRGPARAVAGAQGQGGARRRGRGGGGRCSTRPAPPA